MDDTEKNQEKDVRISDAPRGSPRIAPGLSLRSIHPSMIMESLHNQPGFVRRPADFFDDDTSEEDEGDLDAQSPVNPIVDGELRASIGKKRRSGNYLGASHDQFRSQCEGKRASSPPAVDVEKYLRLTAACPYDPVDINGNSPNLSFDDSVDGNDFATTTEPPRQSAFRLSHRSYLNSMPTNAEDESPILPKEDRVNSHLTAIHALTIQAVLRNQQAVDMGAQALAPAPLQVQRQPKLRHSQAPRDLGHRSVSAPVNNKKVSLVPPPIDTTTPRTINPDDIVRTPYPFQHIHRKDFGTSPIPLVNTSISRTDNTLLLSIRRASHSRPLRSTTLLLPATSDFAALQTSTDVSEKEKYFRALDFDDAEFFRQLRVQYHTLIGAPFRFLAARSLSRITVSGSASRAADAGYGWIASPRGSSAAVGMPRTPQFPRQGDTFSEEKLLRLFYKAPAETCRARYAWVSWAHTLAAAGGSSVPIVTPVPGSAREGNTRSEFPNEQQVEGLEFVLSWSWKRTVTALVLVLLISVAAALLWIFLGTSVRTEVGMYSRIPTIAIGEGFRDAGDRVSTGVVIGICVLLLGLTGIGGWLGVSWLVI